MSEIHDRMTPDQMIERLDDDIDAFGYFTVAIDGDADRPHWAHTVGLVEVFGHPEICVIGEPPRQAELIVEAIASEVADGLEIPLDKDIVIHGVVFHIKEMESTVLLGELFLLWRAYYSYFDDPPIPTLSALEVVRCGNQPNRAQRRAQGRHLRLAR